MLEQDFPTIGTASGSVVELDKPMTALLAYQHILRKWGGCLSLTELMLALMIADRTLGWRKTRASFSTVRMLNGDDMYSGLQMGRSKMFESLASLEAKGIIARHAHPEGKEIKVYSINMGWSPGIPDLPQRVEDPSATRTREKEIREKEILRKKTTPSRCLRPLARPLPQKLSGGK